MKRSLLTLIIISSLTIASNFSFGLTGDLFQIDRHEYSWNYQRIDPISGYGILTDTLHILQLENIKPAIGIYIGYQTQFYKKLLFDIEYGITSMKYDYSFTNGIGNTNDSSMKWSRHTVDIGVSYVLFKSDRAKSSIGIGEALSFVSPLLNTLPRSLVEVEPENSFNRNSLSLNDRRGEYLYIKHQSQLFNTGIDYQIKIQANYIEATFVDWFAPTIRIGIIF